MALFAISYDLIKRKDYPELWDALERIGAHRALGSFWLVNLDNNAAQVCKRLREFTDEDDKLIVVEIVGKPAFQNAKAGTNDWIHRNC